MRSRALGGGATTTRTPATTWLRAALSTTMLCLGLVTLLIGGKTPRGAGGVDELVGDGGLTARVDTVASLKQALSLVDGAHSFPAGLVKSLTMSEARFSEYAKDVPSSACESGVQSALVKIKEGVVERKNQAKEAAEARKVELEQDKAFVLAGKQKLERAQAAERAYLKKERSDEEAYHYAASRERAQKQKQGADQAALGFLQRSWGGEVRGLVKEEGMAGQMLAVLQEGEGVGGVHVNKTLASSPSSSVVSSFSSAKTTASTAAAGGAAAAASGGGGASSQASSLESGGLSSELFAALKRAGGVGIGRGRGDGVMGEEKRVAALFSRIESKVMRLEERERRRERAVDGEGGRAAEWAQRVARLKADVADAKDEEEQAKKAVGVDSVKAAGQRDALERAEEAEADSDQESQSGYDSGLEVLLSRVDILLGACDRAVFGQGKDAEKVAAASAVASSAVAPAKKSPVAAAAVHKAVAHVNPVVAHASQTVKKVVSSAASAPADEASTAAAAAAAGVSPPPSAASPVVSSAAAKNAAPVKSRAADSAAAAALKHHKSAKTAEVGGVGGKHGDAESGLEHTLEMVEKKEKVMSASRREESVEKRLERKLDGEREKEKKMYTEAGSGADADADFITE